MENDGVMDQLICGDVGFGKTEVAIRARFQSGNRWKTSRCFGSYYDFGVSTLQKFQGKIERFSCKYLYLNRFRSAKQKNETKEGLKNGKIDIVIGTHQLVGKDIVFKDLGLINY